MEVLEAFSALSPIIKAITVIGFLMPLAVLHTFLNPHKNPPPKPFKTIDLGNGNKVKCFKININGEEKIIYS